MDRLTMCVCAILTLGYSSAVDDLDLGDACYTPDDLLGICTIIHDCVSLQTLLNHTDYLDEDVLAWLRQAHCGFQGKDPIVCCRIPRVSTKPQKVETQSKVKDDYVETESKVKTDDVKTDNEVNLDQEERPIDVFKHPNINLINSGECGKGSQDRIYYGKKTGLFDFPWMVLLIYRTKFGIRPLCGGTIINERYILTAAHCLTGNSFQLVSVRVGDHDTSTGKDCENSAGLGIVCSPPPLNIGIEETRVHPKYSAIDQNVNDIGIIRLANSLDFRSVTVQPICLPVGIPQQTLKLSGKNGIVTGWGATETGAFHSPDLLKVELPIIEVMKCDSIYKTLYGYKYNINDEKQLCAGNSKTQEDSCIGDSGGPLKLVEMVQSEPRYVQQGIVSYGPRNCGTPGVPGVYTRVSYYMNWILENMRN